MPSISDDAVAAKTGRRWSQWFKLLDARGARRLDHKGIVAILAGEFGVGGWWRQMVTVEYERARGLREVHQQSTGYTVNVSRTMPVAAGRLFTAWKDAVTRRRWLARPAITISSATRPKSVRACLADGSMLDVRITVKGVRKAQVAVEQSRLSSRTAVERQRGFWKARLTRLEELIAT
jgi:hypothetical protein